MAMPAPAAADAPPGAGSRRQALAALCVTEIVSYGVIYYAFPVLAGQVAAGTGWSRTAVTAAYSAGNLTGALAGVPAGRILQRYGPRPVMTAGSVLGALSVAGIAVASSYGWFLTAWLAAGIASAGLFYPPAFAALTGWYGSRRVQALTALTLAAGFASAIFAPLTSALAGPLGWPEPISCSPPSPPRRTRSGSGSPGPSRLRARPRRGPASIARCWPAGRSCCSSWPRRCARSPSTPRW
jgi:MFS family permease